MTENSKSNKTSFNGRDHNDYYFDSENEDIFNQRQSEFSHVENDMVQRVMFVIDDSVEPGKYRGRIYNRDGNIIFAVVKGIINVGGVVFNNINESDDSDGYISDDVQVEKSKFIFKQLYCT